MFFPLGHDTRIQRFPYVTVGIIALNVIVFLLTQASESGQAKRIRHKELDIMQRIEDIDPNYVERRTLEKTIEDPRYKHLKDDSDIQRQLEEYKKDLTEEKQERIRELEKDFENVKNERIAYHWGFVPARWNFISMITYAFLHGGWFHIIGNMLFLWIFGTALEDKWGPYVYTGFYFLGAIAGATLHGIVEGRADIPMIGASGAIFALCGAFMYRFYKTKVLMGWIIWIFFYFRTGKFNVPAWVVMLLYFLDNLASLYLYQGSGQGTAFGAHVGGFLFGLAVAVLVGQLGLEKKYLAPKYDLEGEEHIVPEEYQNALQQIQRGELDAALINLQATLNREKDYLPALSEIFKIYLIKKDQNAAIDMATRVVDGFLKLDEVSFATDTYRRLQKEFSNVSLKPAIQFRIADALVKLGSYHEAAVAYRNLSTNHPGGVMAQKALLACGNILTDKMGEHQNAMNVFKYLAKTYPQSDFLDYAKQCYNRARQALQAQSGGIAPGDPGNTGQV